MSARWSCLALVELACGIAAGGRLIAVGIAAEAQGTAGRSPLDRALPFVLGAALVLGLGAMAVRRWRATREHVPERTSPAPQRASPTEAAAPPPPPRVLSADGERELARIVAVLDAAGVFAPRAPDPEHLREAVADAGEPVTADAVLMAMHEADHYRPAFRIGEHTANLAFHDSHGEQFADTLQGQVTDLARLAGLDDVTALVEIGPPDGPVPAPTRIRLTAGGTGLVLEYAGAAKYLSTELHVALARIARERVTGPRLAWLWSDQGVWLACLRDVERLNAELGPAAGEGWEWVDEQPPTAAGSPGQ